MNFDELKAIGLTNAESRVFSALISTGNCTASRIHEKTGLERRTVYDVLNKLLDKGLISASFENKRKIYAPANIGKLSESISSKQNELERLQSILPEMENQIRAGKSPIQFEVFRGKEGMKTVFEELLDYPESRFIGGGFYIMDYLPLYWIKYNQRRIEKGIKFYNLAKFEMRKRKASEKKDFLIRYLPQEFSGSPVAIVIYGNKVANLLWYQDFSAFVIESKEVADNYRKYFEYLWKKVAKS